MNTSAWYIDCQGSTKLHTPVALSCYQSNLSTAFKWHMLMPMIIKTRVALFHIFVQAWVLFSSSFTLPHIDLTFVIVSTN